MWYRQPKRLLVVWYFYTYFYFLERNFIKTEIFRFPLPPLFWISSQWSFSKMEMQSVLASWCLQYFFQIWPLSPRVTSSIIRKKIIVPHPLLHIDAFSYTSLPFSGLFCNNCGFFCTLQSGIEFGFTFFFFFFASWWYLYKS